MRRVGPLLALLCLLACSHAGSLRPQIAAPEAPGAVPWTRLEPLEDPSDFRFVVVTDRTGEHREEVFRDAMPKLSLVQPAFVVTVGDLIEGYSDDRAVLAEQWDELESFVAQLEMPFFYLPGNHDMSNRVMAEVWRERFGRSFYHFRYKDVLFLMLNSELFGMVHDPKQSVPGPETQAEQMAYIERVLAEHRDARWTFVLLHQPLWDQGLDGRRAIRPDWLRVEELLADRPFTAFAGHIHRYTTQVRKNRQFITLATTGGGSELRGLVHGEFDHVMLVTMRPEGPVIANLLLDGLHDSDLRTEADRKRIETLKRAIAPEARVESGTRFRSSRARFALSNPGDVPLVIRGEFDGGRDLVATPRELRFELAPGATATAEVALRPSGSESNFERLTAGEARFTLETRDRDPLRFERPFPLLPEPHFAVRRAAHATQIDGRLDDWPELPFAAERPAELTRPELHGGPQDLSLRFATRYDADTLYFAVQVRDDVVFTSPKRTVFEQDRIFLSVDAQPEAQRAQNEPRYVAMYNGQMARTVRVNAGPGEARPDGVLTLFLPELAPGIESAAAACADGYCAEFAIPAAVLDGQAGGRWEAFRLQLSVNDYDGEDVDHSVFWWRADRYGDSAIPGSGTFERDQEAR